MRRRDRRDLNDCLEHGRENLQALAEKVSESLELAAATLSTEATLEASRLERRKEDELKRAEAWDQLQKDTASKRDAAEREHIMSTMALRVEYSKLGILM